MDYYKKPKKNKYRFVIWAVLGILIMYFISSKIAKTETTHSFVKHPSPSPTQEIYKSKSLEDAVQNALIGTKGNYGIVIKNLKTNESYFLNEHRTYQSGSLYKLWIMGTTFNQIKNGTLKEDQVLSEDIAVLNDKFNLDDETAELTEGTIELTVSQALQQMITISHNYAALLLTEKIKLSSVAKYIKDNDFNESKVGIQGEAPTTTPYDIASFFEKLYKGQLSDQTYTEKMISLLKAQKLNDKIPKFLPQGIVIAHKTGELTTFTHDAGIVYSPQADYIITVLSDSDTPALAEARISQISKNVYEYLTKGGEAP